MCSKCVWNADQRYAIQFCKAIDSDNYARINLEDVREDDEAEWSESD
jgi:hypothetical protein